MTRGVMKKIAGFTLGLAIVIGPAFAMMHRGGANKPATAFHDYFPPPHLARDRRFRIVAFGSSSTHGYGASSPAATYPAQLQHLLDAAGIAPAGVDVVNRGLDGEDVASMLGRIDDDILSRRPDLVIWQLGSNDALHGATPETFGPTLKAGIAALRIGGVPLVLIGPQWNPDPSRAALFGRMNDVMRAASRDAGLPIVDRFTLMQRWIESGRLDPKDMVQADGLHMTDQGYALLARAVFETIATEVPSLRAKRPEVPAG